MALRLLLDEHYPGWLAQRLTDKGIDAAALITDRPHLHGVDDARVLQSATTELRVVVTEDVNTFSAAVAAAPQHVGIVYCHHARFPRTGPGLNKLSEALVELVNDPPPGLGEHPIVWWLAEP